MNRFKTFFILFVIIFIASCIRLWGLGKIPISPDWDEAALGYNAYSILMTGRDEYGKLFPLILRSFDDYKPALYVYLIIPFIKFFDLSVLSIRLPSALMGIITVAGTYFLVYELFNFSDSYKAFHEERNKKLALLSAFLLAISPWHIQFSRVGFESNVAMGINVFSVFFFLRGFRESRYFFFSAFLFALNLYVYQSEKVFVPLLLISVAFIFRKKLFSLSRKTLFICFAIGFLVVLPMISIIVFDKQSLSRAQGVSFLSEKTPLLEKNVKKLMRDYKNRDPLGQILDNRRIVYLKTIAFGYLSHFDFNWLFIKGDFDTNRHHAPYMGLLYLLELPFLLIGIYSLIFSESREGIHKKIKLLIFSWFLLAPVPASVTTGIPHAVRTLNFLPTFQILVAFGIMTSFYYLKTTIRSKLFQKTIIAGVLLIFSFNFAYYLDQYFVQQNYYYSLSWQYGYKELVDYLKPIHKKYKKVIISNTGEMSQSYIFFLFYLKYDPNVYLANGGTNSGGFANRGNKFSNFEFRPFNYYEEKEKNILLAGTPKDFQELFKQVHRIEYINGKEAIRVVEKER